MASWLVRLSPGRAAWVRAPAGVIAALCSWARHFTLTVPLSTLVYQWVPANLMLGVTLRWTSIPSNGEKKYSQSFHATETGKKLRPDGPPGSYADFTFLPTVDGDHLMGSQSETSHVVWTSSIITGSGKNQTL